MLLATYGIAPADFPEFQYILSNNVPTKFADWLNAINKMRHNQYNYVILRRKYAGESKNCLADVSFVDRLYDDLVFVHRKRAAQEHIVTKYSEEYEKRWLVQLIHPFNVILRDKITNFCSTVYIILENKQLFCSASQLIVSGLLRHNATNIDLRLKEQIIGMSKYSRKPWYISYASFIEPRNWSSANEVSEAINCVICNLNPTIMYGGDQETTTSTTATATATTESIIEK